MCYESWSGGAGPSHSAISECKNIRYLYVKTVEVLCADTGTGSTSGGVGSSSGYPQPNQPNPGGGGGDGNLDPGYMPPNDNTHTQPPYNEPVYNEPGLVDADGNVITSPVMPKVTEEDPCKELAKLSSNYSLKLSLQNLETKAGNPTESGVSVKTFPNSNILQAGQVLPVSADSPNKVDITKYMGGDFVGAMHNHTDPASTGGVPMFSPADVMSLFSFKIKHDNANRDVPPLANAIYFVSVAVKDPSKSSGSSTFIIKIKDWDKFTKAINTLDSKGKLKYYTFAKELVVKQEERGATASLSNIMKDFLSLLSKYNMGVGLYEGNSDCSSWNELDYDPTTKEVKAIPCN